MWACLVEFHLRKATELLNHSSPWLALFETEWKEGSGGGEGIDLPVCSATQLSPLSTWMKTPQCRFQLPRHCCLEHSICEKIDSGGGHQCSSFGFSWTKHSNKVLLAPAMQYKVDTRGHILFSDYCGITKGPQLELLESTWTFCNLACLGKGAGWDQPRHCPSCGGNRFLLQVGGARPSFLQGKGAIFPFQKRLVPKMFRVCLQTMAKFPHPQRASGWSILVWVLSACSFFVRVLTVELGEAVRLLSGPSLGVFGSYYLVQVGFLEVIIWSKFVFLAYKNSGFKRLVLHTQLSLCVFFFLPNFLAIF